MFLDQEATVSLKKMPSQQLVMDLKKLAREERQILSRVLAYLREVEIRRLFIPLGHSSLFDFCVYEIGYSTDQAHRRISAMRLMRELPEAEEKISSGELKLSSAAELHKFFEAQKKIGAKAVVQSKETKVGTSAELSSSDAEKISAEESLSEKRALLSYACENSRPSLQRELAARAEQIGAVKYLTRETVKPVTATLNELKITLSVDAMRKLETLRALYSNKLKDGGIGKLFEMLIDQELERVEKKNAKPARPAQPTQPVQAAQPAQPAQPAKSTLPAKVTAQQKSTSDDAVKTAEPETKTVLRPKLKLQTETVTNRYIPASVRRAVYQRDQGQCQHPNCRATRYLHFDHVKPLHYGGKTTAENLQLLCSAHNLHKGAPTVFEA